MLPMRYLLVLATFTSHSMAILEKTGQADLETVRMRLEEEKAKRLLLENDVEVLMLQVEELRRGLSQISKDNTRIFSFLTFIFFFLRVCLFIYSYIIAVLTLPKASLVVLKPPSGNVTMITLSVAFTATLSQTTAHVSEQTVSFDNVKVNEGNCYDSSTGRFRAPFRGLYILSVTVLQGNTEVHLFIMKDKVAVGTVFSGVSGSNSGSVTVVTVMDKGQTAYVKESPGRTEVMLGSNWYTFTGLLHARYN
ncbi:hypothetical protein CHS0354_027790 [Potamilus streckersoni]|uniref:C1q domain-containing protein n=1 Tax=Potamilus streckersoni TaxID=2493646 RepID=A0AAE0T0V5_9BIVA|nr:hypothetical protein CHS0354_027790 [Potamilus streckersoni]